MATIPTRTRSKRIGLLPLLLAGFALWQWQARRCEREQSRLARTKAKPDEVTTWEGEGGALHGTGSQLGPDPVHP